MAVTRPNESARTATWGWGIVATICALLFVNAAWLYVAVGSPTLFESDTGISASEFRAAYPSVARELEGRGRTLAVLLGGLVALGLTVSIAGLRTGAAWARHALWVLVLALAAVATNALAGSRADIGGFYLVLAGAVAVGVLLTRRDASRS
jgi:hypothetical protein